MNERANLPSASMLSRLVACPGSWRAEQECGIRLTPGPDAERGTAIHAAMEAWAWAELLGGRGARARFEQQVRELEQRHDGADATLDKMLKLTAPIVEEFRAKGRTVWLAEQRLWLLDGGKPVMSGKPDLLLADSSRFLVVDYKTGRGDVAPPGQNWQMAALSVMARDTFEAESGQRLTAETVIIQPYSPTPVQWATYSPDALDTARARILDAITAAAAPDAPRNPGDQCRYCAAASVCPVVRDRAFALAAREAAATPKHLTPEDHAALMPAADLGAFLDRVCEAEEALATVADAVRAEAMRRLRAGETVPGWELARGYTRETITDPTTVYARATAAGVPHDMFMGCVSILKGRLEDEVKRATGAKGKALHAVIRSILDGCVEARESSPTLKRAAGLPEAPENATAVNPT